MLWPAVAGSISDIYASGELRMLAASALAKNHDSPRVSDWV